MIDKQRTTGFTLVELMFAMAFVSFLLVFGVTVIIQTMQTYNKGLSIRQINQSGRQVTEDISRSLRYGGDATVNTTTRRLCSGQLSYAWNIGETNVPPNRYAGGDPTPLRLVQVPDPGGALCDPSAPDIVKADATEIVTTNLIVQCMIPQLREGGRIIAINFSLSTSGDNRPKEVTATGQNIACDRDGNPGTPSTGIECPPGSEGAYCALGEFNTTVYIRNAGS